MFFKIYRSILGLILLIVLWIGIFHTYNSSLLNSITVASEIIDKNIGRYFSDIENSKNHEYIGKIPVGIKDITSNRYLYTLTKQVEERINIFSGTGIILKDNYQIFEKVFIKGDNFVFYIEDKIIEIPTSSYFFDTWNSKSKTMKSGKMQGNHDTKKLIALTFDDGPSARYTNELLDILKEEKVSATFYVLGSKVEQYPDILKREYTEGHEIGNHSYSHVLLTKLSDRMMQEEIYKTDQSIYKVIGTYPKTFRPPYGGTNTGILEKIAMPAILWSIDPRDWKTHNKRKNIASIANAKDGDILIMHDIHETSIKSIPEIIKLLKSQGFTFVTISELLSLGENNTEIGKQCTKKGHCK